MRTMLMSATLLAVLGQATARPGEIPRPDVWIKNADTEPIPVDLREVHTNGPLQVLLMNGESSSASAGAAPLRVRVVPPTWAYRTVTINSAGDPAAALQSLGVEGWETTGLSWTRGQETILLLKRQR